MRLEEPVRLGVLGTMVWDRIDHPDGDRIERWGGISYSLAAAAAAAPDHFALRPLIKVGRDRADQARRFLTGLPLESLDGVLEVPEENNRVHLRYRDRHHRQEVLSGGVPGWQWEELEPRLQGVDALYVNLISGFELELRVAERLRAVVRGPVYADLHSLLLDVAPDGTRVPRRLADRESWLAAFDVVQLNEDELALLAAPGDPDRMARRAVRATGGALLVTRGPGGATWFASRDQPRPWDAPIDDVTTGAVAVETAPRRGDPTGCGDVWGATCFVHLLLGERLSAAVAAANRAAVRNVGHRGADGLHDHLRNPS